MRFISAITTEPHIDAAADTLVAQINAQQQNHAIDFALLFLSPHFSEVAGQVAQTLRDALDPGLLLGCTAEGVIGNHQEIEGGPAISLITAHLPGVELGPFTFQTNDWRQTLPDPTSLSRVVGALDAPRLFLMLVDPFSTPMDRVLVSFNSFFEGVPVVGGLASGAHSQGTMCCS